MTTVTARDLEQIERDWHAFAEYDGDPYQRDTLAERLAESAARIAGGQYRPAYNGWVNRETWNVSLWINNEQGLQEAAIEVVREGMQGSDWDSRGIVPAANERRYELSYAANRLRDWFAETFEPTDTAGPLSDAWTYALAWVDWYEIADGLAEDLPTVGGIGR